MRSLPLVDPALRPLLDMLPRIALDAETLRDLRDREFPQPAVDKTATTLERRPVPGPKGAPDVELHIYRPAALSGESGCIYHMHGGGYVSGAAANLEARHRLLCEQLDCAIVSVDYRLAPETIFPGAVEDCYAGLAWLKRHAGDHGIAPARIGVMGESAGGGLAAALALLARDRSEHDLAFQHLLYPMLDDRTCTRGSHGLAGEFVWTPHNNHFGWSSLLGHEPGLAKVSPYAAPARADNLSGLPPTFIGTGALDLFVEEDMAYAQALVAAGVPTELHVYPGAFHAFDLMPGAPVAQQARRDSRDALRRFLAGVESHDAAMHG